MPLLFPPPLPVCSESQIDIGAPQLGSGCRKLDQIENQRENLGEKTGEEEEKWTGSQWDGSCQACHSVMSLASQRGIVLIEDGNPEK